VDLKLTSEQEMLRESVRAFVKEEIAPVAAALDEAGEFPHPQVKRMTELGLMGIMVPTEYGGAGMNAVSYTLAMEEVSAGCASCGVIMSVNNSLVCDPIIKYGAEAQKKLWLPRLADGRTIGCFALSEPGTGSDAAAQSTVARKEGDTWVINGAKNFITNGAEAGVCVLMAMGDRSKGVKGINAYLVPTDVAGYSVAKNEHKLGIKASSTSQISLDNVRLPADALLGKEGEGF
jgi:butyryl-CoA dehydrogenase